MRRIHRIIIVFALGLPIGCRDRSAPGGQDAVARTADGLERVSLQLNWFPEVEHGGYYAALVHGLYRQAGLDVEIRPGGPGATVIPAVHRGDATFGVTNADILLLGRANDARIRAVMAPIQTSPRCILVHESSGITSLAGLRDITLAMSAGAPFRQFLEATFPLTGVRIVPYPGSVVRFVTDEHYAQQGYTFSEPIIARRQGARPRVLLVADAGFNPYTSVLFASDRVIASRPETVRRTVKASIEGWSRYLEDPAPTNAYIHERNPEIALDVLAEGTEALRPLVLGEPSAATNTLSPASAPGEAARAGVAPPDRDHVRQSSAPPTTTASADAERIHASSAPHTTPAASEQPRTLEAPHAAAAMRAVAIGTMTPERWAQLHAQLERIGALKPGRTRPTDVYTTEFLPPEADE